ncbi:hypothetical protein E0Z10_g3806 [Xylaria hypoxylon]|uniref:Helicase C-terminal domain-containing protein n=1 Tax=Xylaria hypoxylon TaxID=37992 RepID=A0A4Z0Z6H5_9PEZI|nr:hypothetical protein E0Z10_g3806 [Xylaria hypoxylon]
MNYANPRPQKRARLEDGAQCDLPAKGGFLNELPNINQTEFQATTFHGHPRHQVQVSITAASLLEQNTTGFHMVPTDISTQLLTSATQFTSSIPLSSHTFLNSAGNCEHNAVPLSPPAHTISHCDAAENTVVGLAQDSDRFLQSIISKATDETVCFGMVEHLCGTCDVKSSVVPNEVLVKFQSPDQFQSIGDELISGRLHSKHTSMIHGLLQEDTLELFVSCIIDKTPSASKSTRSLKILPCSVEVTVYGPLELLHEIGDWFQEQDIYLQDPRSCYLDAKYCNPQKLSTGQVETCSLVSEVTAKRTIPFEMQVIQSQLGFLDALRSRDDLYEAQQPTAIRSALKRHQKQALTFMIQRENGWNFDQKYIDLWEAHHTDHGTYFINKVSNTYQNEEPPDFRGGVIADTMGLGKTLTMTALVAADLDNPREQAMATFRDLSHLPEVETSLIIIPPPLLDTWEEQLSEHVFDNHLKWCRHHAKNRITSFDELRGQHIVLTTYHTVSAEWKGAKNAQSSLLFSVNWKRIIIDEASLLKFIRATPYDDMKQFETAISSLWKSGEDEEAVRRLQYLSVCLLLRRTKEAIDLPPKQDLLCPVDFSPDERAAYEKLRQQAIYSIDEAVYGHHGSTRQYNHANALQKIESLRLFSDLGLQYHARHEPHADQDWPRIAQQAFNSRRAIEPLIFSKPQFSSCMKFVCVSTGGDAFEEIPDSLSLPFSSTRLSSKVEALITDLRSLPLSNKCVVFSTWRLTLDLIEAGLDQNSIQHIRFDGKVPQNERGAVISRFRTDSDIRVMLLTLSCGAVGRLHDSLTLTVASRAYLMEPHWNPTLEEQALARIHRLGQTQEVTTIRLYMRNSFEEEVMKVQASKKQLANVLLQPHDGGSAGENLSTLQGLRSLL